jgi:hypothetical protein
MQFEANAITAGQTTKNNGALCVKESEFVITAIALRNWSIRPVAHCSNGA